MIVKSDFAQEFKPIKLEITFETSQEVNNFWHILNVPFGTVVRVTENSSEEPSFDFKSAKAMKTRIWAEIDSLLHILKKR